MVSCRPASMNKTQIACRQADAKVLKCRIAVCCDICFSVFRQCCVVSGRVLTKLFYCSYDEEISQKCPQINKVCFFFLLHSFLTS